ncbi:ssk1 response regulator receiver [Agyrium rufum]|nr:ssk1 response regulator receiver [Agyrium rufum]
MADLRSRFLPLFHRRTSASSGKSSISSTSTDGGGVANAGRNRSKNSLLVIKNRNQTLFEDEADIPPLSLPQIDAAPTTSTPSAKKAHSTTESQSCQSTDLPPSIERPIPDPRLDALRSATGARDKPNTTGKDRTGGNPTVTLETPTPEAIGKPKKTAEKVLAALEEAHSTADLDPRADGENSSKTASAESLPTTLTHPGPTRSVRTLLDSERSFPQSGESDYFGGSTLNPTMTHRKIWVKRPGASATLVQINEEDLVDDVREMILKKYANSLGRSFDSPDVTLRIVARAQSTRHSHSERTLGPEEPIARTLDAYFPGGQKVDEALVIDVPHKQTPKHSPRVHLPYYNGDNYRPIETAGDYFPAMPLAGGVPSPLLPTNLSVVSNHSASHQPPAAMSILTTGQPPLLPSPGGRSSRHQSNRPRYGRTNTSSPTIYNHIAAGQLERSQTSHGQAPIAPPLPTPPIPDAIHRTDTPPPARVSSPRPVRQKRSKKAASANQSALTLGLLDGAVPPINVLIVEDNIINLKLLEAFMKRLKVKWHTAMNGREAVNKWRDGGFHLVLMDIQLPVMNGLEATKEIRRLEKVNGVGIMASKLSNVGGRGSPEKAVDPPSDEDKLAGKHLFKSPVIIVALTASSLQSDRHEALAAGCNDFLTKPVSFVWLERKVMEWGCMQALIDFDGWHKWKDFSALPNPAKANIAGGKPALPPAASIASTSSAHNSNPTSVMTSNSNLASLKLPSPTSASNMVKSPSLNATTSPTGSIHSHSSPRDRDLPKDNSALNNSNAPVSVTSTPAKSKRTMINGGSVGMAAGPGTSMAREQRRKEKRSSLGATSLTGVAEDAMEEEGKAFEEGTASMTSSTNSMGVAGNGRRKISPVLGSIAA